MASVQANRTFHALRLGAVGAVLLLAVVALLYFLMLRLLPGWEVPSYLLVKKGRLLYPSIILYGAIATVALLHFLFYGPRDARPHGPGDEIAWWSPIERALHWLFVVAALVLVVTGIELWIAGGGLPSATTRQMRALHVSEPFIVLGSLLFLRWFRDALPRRYDGAWLRHLGGYLGFKGHLLAGKFNAGQKLWFWVYVVTSVLMGLTGHQIQHNYSRFDPEYYPFLALHLLAAMVFLAALALHFYLSVIAVRGALAGMLRGRIGRRAAQQFHSEAEVLREGTG